MDGSIILYVNLSLIEQSTACKSAEIAAPVTSLYLEIAKIVVACSQPCIPTELTVPLPKDSPRLLSKC